MLNDKEKMVSDGNKEVRKVQLTELKMIQDLTILGSDDSADFFCDVNTGICGPVPEKKEEEK
ncbi:hypothetical protein [Ureibacillus manganicus]|uniref:Uncharacterized protein n=1 Tax=Ureibacillus manganicus DSM 26584 TaxID=1384049 RepID=A0A0A3I1P1_9BACL|nr:hypothetical protein [Ureibacillus manganicus]KGR77395.1 hypothetical protein CD29_15115 [Ureibacillus manganicus DSM 26584]